MKVDSNGAKGTILQAGRAVDQVAWPAELPHTRVAGELARSEAADFFKAAHSVNELL